LSLAAGDAVLTLDEAEATITALSRSFPEARVVAGIAGNGELLVVAIWTEPNGHVETLTVRRQPGRYAILNTDNQPLVRADELDEMLAPYRVSQ